MQQYYPALVRKEPESCFGVEVPDLPGCFSAGDSLAEALANATEAVELYLAELVSAGRPAPAPSELEDVLEAGAAGILVPIRLTGGKSVPIHMTINAFLLAEVDRAAAGNGLKRAQWIAEACREKLAR